MAHKIAEAIIENMQLRYIDKKLPDGKIKVHIIYDTEEENITDDELLKIVKETSGIYKKINVEKEAKKLRQDWERYEQE